MDNLIQARDLLAEALAAETLSPYVESRLQALQRLLDGIWSEAWDMGYRAAEDASI